MTAVEQLRGELASIFADLRASNVPRAVEIAATLEHALEDGPAVAEPLEWQAMLMRAVLDLVDELAWPEDAAAAVWDSLVAVGAVEDVP